MEKLPEEHCEASTSVSNLALVLPYGIVLQATLEILLHLQVTIADQGAKAALAPVSNNFRIVLEGRQSRLS